MNILSKNSSLEDTLSKMELAIKTVDSNISFSQELHPLKNC